MIQMFRPYALTRACALVLSMTASLAIAQTSLPPAGVPQSVGVQLKSPNFTVQTIDAATDMGFRVIRRGIYWDAVEKEKGKYDFSKFDEQLNHAKQRGVRVVACLFGGNKLHEDDGRGGVQTEAGRAGFAAFAAAAAEHYKDHALLWEIWNEPNVRTFWRKDGMHNSDEFAQEYTDLVKAVTPAMLKADPNAFVMAGSVSNYWQPSYDWTEACFKKGILTSGIRGWSVHPYGVKTPEEFTIGHTKTRDLLKQNGAPTMPIINTERGFAIKKPTTQLELEGWSGGAGEQIRNFQAAHYVRQFMIDQLNGVSLTIWYEWDGGEFGIMDKDGKRPIEAAARFMSKRLNGYSLEKRLESDNKLDYLLLWKDSNGNRQLVVWTAPPPAGAPDEARPHEIAIHTTGAGKFDVAQMTGETAPIDSLKLTLTGLPQYIALPAGVELGKITTSAPAPLAPAAPEPNTLAANASDLKLFDGSAEWKFEKNTGEGSFTLATDDAKPVGVMQFDFSKSAGKSMAYVLASAPVKVAEGASAIHFSVRTARSQRVTVRLVDSTGQNHQFKASAKGTGTWETVRVPLTKKLEHWGGQKDGKIHFPIERIIFSLPAPEGDEKTGKVEFTDAVSIGK